MKPVAPPNSSKSAPINVSFNPTTSTNQSLGGLKGQVHVKCLGPGQAHIRFGNGSQTAVTTDWALLAGDVEEYEIRGDEDNVAVIGASGDSGTVQIRRA